MAFLHISNAAGMDPFAAMEAIELNNEGGRLLEQRRYDEALAAFKASLDIKLRIHGEVSLHACITQSNMAECYLDMRNYDMAEQWAARMLRNAEAIQRPDQIRIGREILDDIATARRTGVLPDKKPITVPPGAARMHVPSDFPTGNFGSPTMFTYSSDLPPTPPPADSSACHRPGCKAKATSRCSRCKKARYCSSRCAVSAYPQHKLECVAASSSK